MKATRSVFTLAILIVSIQVFYIAAFAGQGVLDNTFGTNGVKDTTFANPTFINDTVVSGNKIWFAGIASFNPRNHIIYGRFSLDGTLDFSTIVRPCNEDPNNLQDSSSSANKISLQPDGKLLVTGKCQAFNAGNFQNPFALRINTDGTLDSSFGVGGIALLDLRTVPACGTLQTTYDIALAPDGNIIAVGGEGVTPVSSGGCPGSMPATILLKISPAGTLVTSSYFPSGNTASRFVNLTIQPDGKFIVGYNDDLGTTGSFEIYRYNNDFTPDTSFGVNGRATYPVDAGGPRGSVRSIYRESSGKVVVLGISQINARASLARFLPNGTLDTTFNGTGKVILPEDNGVPLVANKIFRQPDGRYLIGSTSGGSGWGGYRVNPNGTVDSTYGNRSVQGIVYLNPPVGATAGIPAVLADGSMIQFGYANVSERSIVRLVKINQNQNRNADRFDFDGDAKTDISIFRPGPGEWWYLKSTTGGNTAAQFGNSNDKITPGDFTGDGKTDFAFWRPGTGFWFILRSDDSTFFSFPFGTAGDIPVPADYDGDGKMDAAVFRPTVATWFILRSGDGGITISSFGVSADKPIPADYDGDGKADIAIWRPSVGEWWYSRSSTGITAALQFGSSTDKPVPGDYTGDGKADIAFFRPSTGFWFILRSENASFFSFPFGASGDIPVAGDYDGDGKFDSAVFRPSNSTWFLNQTTAGVAIVTFGIAGDQPVPNAFVP